MTEVTNDYNARKRVMKTLGNELLKSFAPYKISNKWIVTLRIFLL